MTYTPSQIEHGRKLFAGECEFIAGAALPEQLPEATLQEIAFAGRSNVGKSSLLNALTGRNTLARVSHTPGRTRQINFFSLRNKIILVDLPGYGHAQVSKKESLSWNRLIIDYIRGRPTLQRVCILIDARHGLKPMDTEVMKIMDDAAVNYQMVLTKTDKVKKLDAENIISAIHAMQKKHPAMHPQVICTSSHEQAGIEELRAELGLLVKE